MDVASRCTSSRYFARSALSQSGRVKVCWKHVCRIYWRKEVDSDTIGVSVKEEEVHCLPQDWEEDGFAIIYKGGKVASDVWRKSHVSMLNAQKKKERCQVINDSFQRILTWRGRSIQKNKYSQEQLDCRSVSFGLCSELCRVPWESALRSKTSVACSDIKCWDQDKGDFLATACPNKTLTEITKHCNIAWNSSPIYDRYGSLVNDAIVWMLPGDMISRIVRPPVFGIPRRYLTYVLLSVISWINSYLMVSCIRGVWIVQLLFE